MRPAFKRYRERDAIREPRAQRSIARTVRRLSQLGTPPELRRPFAPRKP